jgi:hypothetical protein
MEFIRLSTGEIVKISTLGSPILVKDSDGYMAYYEEIPEAMVEAGTLTDTLSCLSIALNAVADSRKKELIKCLCLN